MLPHAARAGRRTAGARPAARRATGRPPAARPRRRAGASRGSARRGSRPRRLAADHRLAVGPGAPGPRPGPPVADRRAVERGHRQDPGHARRQERLVGVGEVRPAPARPSTGRSPTRGRPAEQPRPRRAGQDRAVERRRRQLERPVARRRRTRNMLADRRLGQVAVDGQEQGVVRAGPARLEAGVDVVGAGRRLERRQRVLRVAPDGRRDEMQPVLEVPGRRARRPARPGSTIVAGTTSSGGSTPRARNAPRDTVIRIEASPSGPSRPSAASSSAIAAASAVVDVGRQRRCRGPSAERCSRARCSASSVGRPPRARSVSKTPSPSWKPRSKTDRWRPSAGRSSPSTQT